MTAPKKPRAPKVKLEITQEIIDDAIERDSSHCLWAEAIKSAYPGASRVSVDLQTMRFTDPAKGLRYTYLTPRIAQVALVNFDQGVMPDEHSVTLKAGHVTAAGKRQTSDRELSPAQKEQRKKAAKRSSELLKKTTLRHAGGSAVPDRVGGRTPPIGAGARREFGLRGLSR